VLLAAIFLSETIGPLQLVGGTLILAAVILLARHEKSADRRPPKRGPESAN
jgi:drug/metabolite transporter (DMT)-like permease